MIYPLLAKDLRQIDWVLERAVLAIFSNCFHGIGPELVQHRTRAHSTNMSTKWDLLVRPPKGVCPEKYCFHWVTPGGYADVTGRRYASREEALRNAECTPFPDGGCSC